MKEKWQKLLCRRIVAIILILSLAIGTMPATVFAASEDEPVLLQCTYPEDDENMFSIATQSASVNEKVKYIVTVVRSSDASDSASVSIQTVDISATYGEDYIISDNRYVTEVFETAGTVLQQSADKETQHERYDQMVSSLEQAQEEIELFNEQTTASEEEKEEVSDLAFLKEEQTGLPTRPTGTTEFEPISELLLGDALENFGDYVESSSSTLIEFAPGETEKQIIFEVLDDDISEGDETFDLILADVSEGYSVGNSKNCTITITDDEPAERSSLSFSQAEYSAESGVAEITITRSGAEYSFVTAKVTTSDGDNSISGKDYSAVETEIALEPYKNEYVLTVPVLPGTIEKTFNVELSDFKGCDPGETVSAVVKIPTSTSSWSSSLETLAEDQTEDEELEFTIEIDSKDYTVRYVKGDSIGKIYDTSYIPEVCVGDYYFVTKDATFGIYTGDDGSRSSYYDANLGENGAAVCKYYKGVTWKEGGAGFNMNKDTEALFNTQKYQYICVDWSQGDEGDDSARYNTIQVKDASNKKGLKSLTERNPFSRQISAKVTFLDSSSLPMDNDVFLFLATGDDSNVSCPHVDMKVYGVPAMYRQFKITLIQPTGLKYLNSEGEYVVEAPANVTLGEGHSTRFYGQSLQIKTAETTSGEPIKGVITKYEITVGTSSDNQVTFEYVPKGDNIQNIAFDDDFIDILDEHTKQVSKSNGGFVTELRIKPVFEYKDVTVEVLESEDGSFTDSKLTPGIHTFHVGDEIILDGVSENSGTYYVGFEEYAYKNASDTYPIISGIMDGRRTIMLDNERYVLRPVFSETENHITIKLSKEAQEVFTVLNTVNGDILPDNIELKDGEYILNTGESTEAYVPTVGKVYQIQLITKKDAGDGKIYRPVFSTETSTQKVNSYVLDFVAEEKVKNNVITVDVEEINESDLKMFKIDGYVKYPGNAIRSSSFNVTEAGAVGVTVIGGGEISKLYDNYTNKVIKVIDRVSDSTSSDGSFSLKGVYAKDGDTITLRVGNNEVERVEYITVSSQGATEELVSYVDRYFDEETNTTVEKTVEANMSSINKGTLYMPIRTPNAPFVNNITYTVDPIKDVDIDTRDNAVPIVSTRIYITADVNLNGREVKEVIFIRVPKDGAREETVVEATKKGQTIFTAQFTMDTTFEDGDMIYVSLVDAEDRVITVNTIDDEGNITAQTTREEIRYADVFTGLTFYIPTLEVEPQFLNMETRSSVTVPVLGEMLPTVTTGKLSFTKRILTNEPNSPYYIEFLFAPGISNMEKKTAYTILEGVKASNNNAIGVGGNPKEEEKKITDELNKTYSDGKEKSDDALKQEVQANENKKSNVSVSPKFMIDARLSFIFSFYFSYDETKDTYVMTLGQYSLGAFATVGGVINFTIYGVPLYVKPLMDLQLYFSGLINADQTVTSDDMTVVSNLRDVMDFDSVITAGVGGNVSVGVGFCGALSARGTVTGDIVIKIDCKGDSAAEVLEGFLFKFGGGFGIDLFLFSFDYVPDIVTVGTGVYENETSILSSEAGEDSISVRTLNTGSFDTEDFGSNYLLSSSGENVSQQILAENTVEYAKPQILMLDDGRMMMLFMDDDPSRNGINSRSLYYTIADEEGLWSEPVLVDDNGTADAMPSMKKIGDKVLISWIDENKTYENSDSPKDVLSGLEIAYTIYDPATDSFSEKTLLTQDDYFDMMPQFGYSETTGNIFCYYLKRDIKDASSNEEILDFNATYSTIAYRIYDGKTGTWGEETYLNIPCEDMNDPLIIDFNSTVRHMDNSDVVLMTYTIDSDQNLQTTDDRDVYLYVTDITNKKSYYPIRITNDYKTDISPKITEFNDNVYLTWVSGESDFCMINLTSMLSDIELTGKLDYLKNADVSSPDWYKLTAADLGMTEEEYNLSIFSSMANGDFPIDKKTFCLDEDQENKANVCSYTLVQNDNESLYLLWLEPGQIDDEGKTSQEIYGSVMELTSENSKDKINTYTGWSDPVQIIHTGKMLDEYSIAFGDNNNIYMAANMYEQQVDEEGTLSFSENDIVLFEASITNNMKFTEEPKFAQTPRAGEENSISLSIKNEGLKKTEGYKVDVIQTIDGTDTVIYSESFDNVIMSGETVNIDVPWTVPDNIDNLSIKAKVTANNITNESETVNVEKKADIVLSEPTAQYKDGNFYASVTVTNEGNIPSDELTLTASAEDNEDGSQGKVYGSTVIEPLEPGESTIVEYELTDINADDLDKYGNEEIYQRVYQGDECIEVARCMLNVLEPIAISVDTGDTLSMGIGEEKQFEASVKPLNVSGRELVYSTSDSSVVNVSNDGKLTAVSSGTTVITVMEPKSGVKTEIAVEVNGILGDVNHDNEITVLDVTAIQIYLTRLKPEGIFDESLADINKDGKINIIDASLLQLMLVK